MGLNVSMDMDQPNQEIYVDLGRCLKLDQTREKNHMSINEVV
ncbi:hypothetical protein AF72_08770 [Xylella taiwanensis]|uniref:Uncharacterized protein n=1 Tax=Xylella taiwanensis TaxID=1444770 RepID=Z9JJ50_9GAMM|nr:hypothetical protein AF72_08770 [Xylella taiwanensis]